MKKTIILAYLLTNIFCIGSINAAVNSIFAIINDDIITSSQLEEKIDQYMLATNSTDRPDRDKILALLDREVYKVLQKQYAISKGIEIKAEALNRNLITLAKKYNITLADLKKLPNYNTIVNTFTFNSIITGLRSIIGKDITTVNEIEVDAQYKLLESNNSNYKYHIYNIVFKDINTATQVLLMAKNNQSFSELAKKYSKSFNAKNGGDMGYMDYKKIPTLYKRILKTLKSGDISEVISGGNSYHLLKLADKKQKITIKEQVKIKHILIPRDTSQDPIMSQMPDRALEKILNIYARLQKGADFSKLAKEYSKGDHAKNGGELPWISIESLPKEAIEALMQTDTGALSSPFKTDFGWHIMQKLGQRKVDLAKINIRNRLLSDKKNKLYQEFLEKLKKRATIIIYDKKIK